MNFRFQAAALTLTTFLVTLGFSLWHQRGLRPRDSIAETAPTAPAPYLREAPRVRSAVNSNVEEAQSPRPDARPLAAPAESEPPPPAISTAEVPAFVLLGSATENQPGREATLRNASSQALEVGIMANNPMTGHQASAEVALAPFARVSLADEGFRVESGDLLTLHSPPFRDRTIEIKDEAN